MANIALILIQRAEPVILHGSYFFVYLCSRRTVLSLFGFQREESPGRIGRRAVESTGSRKVRVGVTENNHPISLWSGKGEKAG